MNAGQAVRLVVNKDGTVGVSVMASERDHNATETFSFATFAEASAFAEQEMSGVLKEAQSAAKTAANLAAAEAKANPAPGKRDGETDLEFSKRVADDRHHGNRGQTRHDKTHDPKNADTESARSIDSANRAAENKR